jgi:hypothetical protein
MKTIVVDPTNLFVRVVDVPEEDLEKSEKGEAFKQGKIATKVTMHNKKTGKTYQQTLYLSPGQKPKVSTPWPPSEYRDLTYDQAAQEKHEQEIGIKVNLEDIKWKLNADVVGRKTKAGTIIAKWGYFYRMERSPEKYAARVKQLYPNAEIVDKGDHWATFRGGAKTGSEQSSYMYVEFKLGDK